MDGSAEETLDLGEELLVPAEVSTLTKLTKSTLKDKRWKGTGPDFIKLSPGRGGRIRYRRRDVESWLTNLERKSEAA